MTTPENVVFVANVPFSYPLKTSENQRNRIWTWNRLISNGRNINIYNIVEAFGNIYEKLIGLSVFQYTDFKCSEKK